MPKIGYLVSQLHSIRVIILLAGNFFGISLQKFAYILRIIILVLKSVYVDDI